MNDLIGREILYSGRVQGVGFRQSVYILAVEQHVSGYVQNLDNGKVRLVVEGKGKGVVSLLEDVKRLWAHNLSDVQITNLQTTGLSSDFIVRY